MSEPRWQRWASMLAAAMSLATLTSCGERPSRLLVLLDGAPQVRERATEVRVFTWGVGPGGDPDTVFQQAPDYEALCLQGCGTQTAKRWPLLLELTPAGEPQGRRVQLVAVAVEGNRVLGRTGFRTRFQPGRDKLLRLYFHAACIEGECDLGGASDAFGELCSCPSTDLVRCEQPRCLDEPEEQDGESFQPNDDLGPACGDDRCRPGEVCCAGRCVASDGGCPMDGGADGVTDAGPDAGPDGGGPDGGPDAGPTCDPNDCDDDNPCTLEVCETDGTCRNEPAPGTGCMLPDGTGGVCNAMGSCVPGTACDSDTDCDDGNACTMNACSGGVCTEQAVVEGATCSTFDVPMGFCSASGDCVECLEAGHCSTPPGPCKVAACVGGACTEQAVVEGATCSTFDVPMGFCSASGDCVECLRDADCSLLPGADPACAMPACSGTPPACSITEQPRNTPCPGGRCDMGACMGCAAMVAVGGSHTCAAIDGGATTEPQVLCWGSNGFGQAGQDPTTALEIAAPTPVTGLEGRWVRQLALGMNHSCALADGPMGAEIYCWGDNGSRQVSSDTGPSYYQPQRVPHPSALNWVDVAAGNFYTCAVDELGSLYCWGNVPGIGLTTTPTRIATMDFPDGNVRGVEAGDQHVCALVDPALDVTVPEGVDAYELWCWGDNSYGQLGLGDRTARSEPTRLMKMDGNPWLVVGPPYAGAPPPPGSGTVGFAETLALGNYHSCALMRETSGYRLHCWGSNALGQVGPMPIPGDAVIATSPQALTATIATTATSVRAGTDVTCALGPGGFSGARIQCWGASGYRQNGSMVDSATPITLSGLDALDAGAGPQVFDVGSHGCALDVTSRIRCWGLNTEGQLGAPTEAPSGSGPDDVASTPNPVVAEVSCPSL